MASTKKHQKGVACVPMILPPDVVRTIRGMRRRGDTYQDITTWTGLSSRQVINVLRGRRPEYASLMPYPTEQLPPPPPYKIVSERVYDHLCASAAIPLAVLEKIEARLQVIERHITQGERGNVDIHVGTGSEVPPVHGS